METKKEVKKYLLRLEDKEYLKFSQNLNIKNKNYKQIGVRIPMLRKYAIELSKKYDLKFLINNIDEEYYEELMLKGILIGSYKNISYEELEKYINIFVPKIDDWAICDSFCSSLKITKKYYNEMWNIIESYLKSNKEFEVRFALVMILNYYIDDEHIEEIYKIINNVSLDKYYVKMANAWLISYCVIKYYKKTLNFLKNNAKLDKWTYNKGIQKSIESFCITKEQKIKLKKIKNKLI